MYASSSLRRAIAICRRVFTPAVLLFSIATVPLGAQEVLPPRHVGMTTGLFQFELAEKGVGPMLGFRGTSPLASSLLIEFGLLGAWAAGTSTDKTLLIVPETQVQLVFPVHRVTPYMGLGMGALVDVNGDALGRRETFLTISGSLGAKTWVMDRLGVQGELRVRAVSVQMDRSAIEYTVGMIWRV